MEAIRGGGSWRGWKAPRRNPELWLALLCLAGCLVGWLERREGGADPLMPLPPLLASKPQSLVVPAEVEKLLHSLLFNQAGGSMQHLLFIRRQLRREAQANLLGNRIGTGLSFRIFTEGFSSFFHQEAPNSLNHPQESEACLTWSSKRQRHPIYEEIHRLACCVFT